MPHDDLLAFFKERQSSQIEKLRQMVELESPSHDKALLDRLGQHIQAELEALHATVTLHEREVAGNIRFAAWNKDAPGLPLMFLCHTDTVWPAGTLAHDVPINITDDRFHGPGALDMKSGIVVALDAIRGLQELDELPNRPIWMLLTTDEEVGSVHSRDLIKELAAQAGLVIVMEPAADYEAVKTWRKGIAYYNVTSLGQASHAGMAPEEGVNALLDSAHQLIKIDALNDLPNGTSVSVTQLQGGTAPNVIPASAQFHVDVRFLKSEEARRIDNAMKNLEPVILGASVEVEGYIDRPPMERNELMVKTFKQAQ